jgi:DNA-binding CsgD family transcriptional regulator
MNQASDDFIHAIYGAILDASQWKVALSKLAALADAPRAALMDSDFAASVVYREVLFGMDEAENHRYLQEFASIDPRVPVALGNYKLSWLSDHDLFDEEFRKKERIYKEFLRPGGVGESLFATFAREGSRMGVALLARSIPQGKAAHGVRTTLATLMPHLDRAVKISRRFEAMATEVILSHNVLDAMPEPLGCATADGRLHRANHAFEESLRLGGVISMDGILRVRDTALQSQFLRAIQECCRIAEGGTGSDPEAHLTIRIDRPTEAPCFITIAPLAAIHLKSWAGRPCALIRIDEPKREMASDTLIEALGLSTAEARLVSTLYGGGTLAAAAKQIGVSLNTAKTQLASAFSKTSTTRQSELLTLVAALPSRR